MATDSTLQKIADNLLAQFDKTLLDNSTDFSSCDQILNAAPSEHKGGLESLYCDLLLDALISGYYRYSEMDTKQLVDDPLYTKFKKMVYGLDRSDPYNLLYYAIIDLVSGKKENVLQYLSAYLDEKIKSLKTESGIFTAEDFTYILVVPLKEGFPGMWSAIGRMLDRDDVEAGIPEMCAALDHLYVIELKKDSGYDDAYAQTREYIDWIEEDVAVKGQRVFGIICLNDPTKDLIEKVKADDQMRLFEYSISYSEII